MAQWKRFVENMFQAIVAFSNAHHKFRKQNLTDFSRMQLILGGYQESAVKIRQKKNGLNYYLPRISFGSYLA